MAKEKSSTTWKGAGFSIRATAHQEQVIAQAARLRGVTVSGFVLEQAVLAARQGIDEQARFTLSKKRWKLFCAALDAPPKPIAELRRLLTAPGIFDDAN